MRLFALITLALPLCAQSWYATGGTWSSRKVKAIDHRRVASDLTNFPYYFAFDNDADLAGNLKSDCSDVVVTLADGTKLDREVIVCDATAGTLHGYARVPTVSSTTDTPVLIYFGNADGAEANAKTTWDSNYIGVFHGGSGTDSSQTGYNLSTSGTVTPKSDGPLGTAGYFDGTASIQTNASTMSIGSGYTIETIFKSDTTPSGSPFFTYIAGARNGTNPAVGMIWDSYEPWNRNFCHNFNGGFATAPFGAGAGGDAYPSGNRWYIAVGTWDGSTAASYLDGIQWTTAASATLDSQTSGLIIGGSGTGSFWRGEVAEIRVSKVARSRAWLAFESFNIWHPDQTALTSAVQTNNAAVKVEQLTASYLQTESGRPVTLRWLVENASTMSIDHGVGSQSALVAGFVTVSPTSTTTYTMTVNGSVTQPITITVISGTALYIRNGWPAGTWPHDFTTDGSGHALITTFEPHNLLPGDYVEMSGFATTDAGNTHQHASNLNGRFVVAEVLDQGHFTVKDMSGAFVVPNDTWVGSIVSAHAGAYYVGRVTPFPAAVGMKGLFDGTDGTIMHHLGATPSSVSVASNVATITFSFNHDIQVGDLIAVKNTLAGGNMDAEHTVTATTATSISFATSGVADGTYTNPACGPGSIDPTTISGTEKCERVSQFAISTNHQWTTNIKPTVEGWSSDSQFTHVFDGGSVSATGDQLQWMYEAAAFYFLYDPTNARALRAGRYILNHLERFGGVNFPVVANSDEGGSNDIGHFLALQMEGFYLPYSVFGRFQTIGEHAATLGKLINDVQDPSNLCNPSQPVLGTGTATLSGTTVTISGGTTAGFNVGDAIVAAAAGPTWNSTDSPFDTNYVSAVVDATHLTVILGTSNRLNGTPQSFYRIAKWTTGDCGIVYRLENTSGVPTVHPALYSFGGGSNMGANTYKGYPSPYSNGGAILSAWLMGAMGSACADEDARCGLLAERGFSFFTDGNLMALFGSRGGPAWDGVGYGWDTQTLGAAMGLQLLHSAVPSLDLTGPTKYLQALARMKIWQYLPGTPGGTYRVFPWSASSSAEFIAVAPGSIGSDALIRDYYQFFQPATDDAKRLRDWEMVTNFLNGESGSQTLAPYAIVDPRIPRETYYTGQGLQTLFSPSGFLQDCIDFTGWDGTKEGAQSTGCGTYPHSDIISRTSWTDTSATYVRYLARSCCFGYDAAEVAQSGIYKAGYLLANDSDPGNMCSGCKFETDQADLPVFNGARSLRNGSDLSATFEPIVSRMVRSSTGNDNFAFGCADISGAYVPQYNLVTRCWAHMKRPSTSEYSIQFDDIDTSNVPAGSIRFGRFYTQNGETLVPINGDSVNTSNEGTTVCSTTATCDNAHTNLSIGSGETIISHENGAGADANGPARIFGLLTRVFSPNTFSLTWQGTGFTNAAGHADRVDVSVTGPKMTTVTVDKITSNTDTTLVASAINPDTNWTGVQTDDKVVMFSRGGVLRTSLGFTSTHSGTADYLLAGFAPGSYAVTVNATPVSGSPFTVTSGDSTIFFSSTAGTVSVGGGSPAPCSITTTTLPNGTVGVAYSQAVNTANCTSPITWSITSGTLCSGLSQNASTGVISGTPTTAQTCSFTVQAVDSAPNTASQALSITINPGAGLGGSILGGTAVHGGNLVIH